MWLKIHPQLATNSLFTSCMQILNVALTAPAALSLPSLQCRMRGLPIMGPSGGALQRVPHHGTLWILTDSVHGPPSSKYVLWPSIPRILLMFSAWCSVNSHAWSTNSISWGGRVSGNKCSVCKGWETHLDMVEKELLSVSPASVYHMSVLSAGKLILFLLCFCSGSWHCYQRPG